MTRPRRPRRILVLNERDLANPLAGGAEVHIFEIFERLVARGHEVTLLAASFPGASGEEIVRGVRVKRLANRYLYYARVPWVARRLRRSEGFDLVVDVLNKLPFLSPWLVGPPCFAIVHHLFGTSAFRQVAFPIALATWLSERLIPHAYRRTPMLAISPSTKQDLVARGLPADRVRVVPPGVDHDAYSVDAGAPRADRSILWLGRLEPYKRADVMLEAMVAIRRSIGDAKLIFVGEGSARSDLQARSAALGLDDCVRFVGFVPEDEKIAWLQRSAVVVNTSEKEGWGMTVIEGNACGAVSVSSAVPGLRDSVRDEETGLLYPFADVGALADAVVRVLGDDALRERLVAGGLSWAARFAWEHVADDVERLMEEAIAPTGSGPQLVASPF